jgi:hypothetical protein
MFEHSMGMALTGLRFYLVGILGARPMSAMIAFGVSLFCLAAVHSLCSMFYNGTMILKVLYPNLTPCSSRPGCSQL